jgi:predicted transcriptional regulator
MPTELKERIEKAARERNQNPSSPVERAFALFLTVEEAHLVEVLKGAAEADAGDTVPHEEVERQPRSKYTRSTNAPNENNLEPQGSS